MIETSEQFSIDYIDASSISCFDRCPARYLFERLMGLAQPGDNRIAPDFGTDIHRALPFCYSSDKESSRKAVEQFKLGWDARPYGEEDEKRNSMNAVAILSDFTSKRVSSVCPYEILHYENITAPNAQLISDNEVPFLIDIGGKLPAAGRIDCIVRWKDTGWLWALDYKTASEISDRYFNNFWFSPQACLYTLAASHIANERAYGFIIDALRVSKTRTETSLRHIFVQDHEIKVFLDVANSISYRILKCNDTKKWTRNPVGCSSYSSHHQPGRTCCYKSICESPNWESAVPMYERKKPFNPFEIG